MEVETVFEPNQLAAGELHADRDIDRVLQRCADRMKPALAPNHDIVAVPDEVIERERVMVSGRLDDGELSTGDTKWEL